MDALFLEFFWNFVFEFFGIFFEFFWNFLGSALSLSSPENPEKGSSIRKSAVVTGYFTHGSHASVHKQSEKTRLVSAQH